MSPTPNDPDDNILSVSEPAALADLISYSSQHGPWLVPLLRAASSGVLQLMMLPRGQTPPLKVFNRHPGRPAVILLGDDDGAGTGPAGWAETRQVRRYWARAAIVHATGGEPEHYEAVVALALHYRQLLMIETGTQHAAAWMEAVKHVRKVAIIQSRDGAHPVAPQREGMH